MVHAAEPIAFIPSTDLARSREFYENVLGLEILSQDGFAVVARAGAIAVRITDVGADLRPQPFTVFGWEVDDLRSVVSSLVTAGVEFLRPAGLDLDDDGVWTAPDGTQVAWFQDPDGNTLSVDRHPPDS